MSTAVAHIEAPPELAQSFPVTSADPYSAGRLVMLLAVVAGTQHPDATPEAAVAAVADDVRFAIGQEAAAASQRAGNDMVAQEQIALVIAEMLAVLELAQPLAVDELRRLRKKPIGPLRNPSTPEGEAALYAWVGDLIGGFGGTLIGLLVGSVAAAAGAVGAGVALAALGGYVGGAVGARYGVGRAPRIPRAELRETKNYTTLGALLLPWLGIGSAVGAYLGAAPNPRRAAGMSPEQFDPTQLAAGTAVEMEHTDDRAEARRIAMDHLAEHPGYYVALAEMERGLGINPYLGDAVAQAEYRRARAEWERRGRRGPPPPPPRGRRVEATNPPGSSHAREAKRMVNEALKQGCTLVTSKKHYKIRCPGGEQITMPKTPSDSRGLKNARARLRRAGIRVNPSDVTIRVALLGGAYRDVAAEQVTPHIVIHPSIRTLPEVEAAAAGKAKCWGVTHAPTGALIATVCDEDWARQLAQEIERASGPGIGTPDVVQAQRVIGGPGMRRALYIGHVSRQSGERKRDRGEFPTFREWSEMAHELDTNPDDPESIRAQAAVSAAVTSLIGGIAGALVGAVVLGGLGAIAGAAAFGGEAGLGGGIVGAVYGIPLGGAIGTIWGAVRGAGKATEGRPSQSAARVGAGFGSAVFGPIGAGVGAYVGAG